MTLFRVWVCSSGQPDFTRCLPRTRLMERGRGAARAVARCGEQWGRLGRVMTKILLAEDDTDMRRFLLKALQNAGFDVISYDNGLSAYQRLREEPFELLLTDIVMPEMGRNRACAPRGRARSRHEDHVHHRLRGRRAQFQFDRAASGQSAVEAVSPARARQRGE